MKLTRIDYQNGYLWVDKKAKLQHGDLHIEDELIINTFHNYLTDLEVCNKIIAQSLNLSIPNVPYVEFEENIVYKGLQAAWSYLTALGYFNKPSEEGERVEKLLLNALAAQSKGRYSEEDIEAAIHNAQSASNLHTEDDVLISRKFLEQYFKSLNQPPLEIEIQTKQVCGDTSCLRMSLNGEDSTCCGDSIITIPITYERDGNPYLKRKLPM